jgi:glutamyl-tRNA synthetase
LGNIINFILTRLETSRLGGTMLLRIDDADSERARDEYVQDIFNVLQWLDIRYEEGPKDVHDFKQHFTQVLRKKHYDVLLQKLAETELLFACNCSRSEVLNNPTHTRCKHQNIDEFNEGYAWRLNTENAGKVFFNDGWLNEQTVDIHTHTPFPVMRKKGGFAAYTICSLADDVYYNINLIMRGEDLLYQTALQLHVAKCCGLDTFLTTRFYHHRLLCDDSGNKLSKSAGSSKQSILQVEPDKQKIYEAISNYLNYYEAAVDFSTLEKLYLQHGYTG